VATRVDEDASKGLMDPGSFPGGSTKDVVPDKLDVLGSSPSSVPNYDLQGGARQRAHTLVTASENQAGARHLVGRGARR
jgi:hypothetical protein